MKAGQLNGCPAFIFMLSTNKLAWEKKNKKIKEYAPLAHTFIAGAGSPRGDQRS
jgi:hypothetical protein